MNRRYRYRGAASSQYIFDTLSRRDEFICSDILISMKLTLTYLKVLNQMSDAGNIAAKHVVLETLAMFRASNKGYNFRRSFVARVHRGVYRTPFAIEWRGRAMATAVAERVCGDAKG